MVDSLSLARWDCSKEVIHRTFCNVEINQLELAKLGVPELLIRQLSNEDLNVVRKCLLALTSLCLNGLRIWVLTLMLKL